MQFIPLVRLRATWSRVVTCDSKDVDISYFTSSSNKNREYISTRRKKESDYWTFRSSNWIIIMLSRPWEMHVPSWFGAGPSTTHARSHVTGNVSKLQVTIEFVGWRSGTAGTLEDAGTRREGYALLYERIRSESRR